MAQRLKFLSEDHGKASGGKEIENWDADFDDINGDLNFTSSISSVGSTTSVSLPRDARTGFNGSGTAPLRGERLLRTFSEELNDDSDFDDYNLTAKLSNVKLSQGSSDKEIHHVVNLAHMNDNNANVDTDSTLGALPKGSLHKMASKSTIRVARNAGIRIPSDVPESALVGGTIKRLGAHKVENNISSDYSDDLMLDDNTEIFTIRARPQKQQENQHHHHQHHHHHHQSSQSSQDSFENSLISGSLYEPPSAEVEITNSLIPSKNKLIKDNRLASPQKLKFIDAEEDEAESWFDLESAPATLSKKIRLPNFIDNLDSGAEESLGFRSNSRLSHASSYSETTTTSESESEDRDFATDFAEVPESVDVFRKKLELQRKKAQEDARKETEFLTYKKAPGALQTISPRKHSNSKLLYHNDPVEFEDEFLEGIEINDDDTNFLGSKETVHKNVIVKNNVRFVEPKRIKKPGVSMQFVSDKTLSPSKSSANMRTVSAKHSTPHIDLRSKMSMPALRHDKTKDRLSPEKQDVGSMKPRVPSLMPSASTPQINKLANNSDSSPPKRNTSSMVHPRLRAAQSMLNLNPSSLEPSVAALPSNSQFSHTREARPKYSKGKKIGRFFGNGSELDGMDELPINPKKERMYTITPRSKILTGRTAAVPLDVYREKASEKAIRHHRTGHSSTTSTSKRRKRIDKGPGLIRQLGQAAATTLDGVNGEMHFNPTKLIWEGNDLDLKKFDSINPKTPGLIAFISNKGVQVVGDMVFDSERLRWVNVSEDQESNDPFEGLEDLDVSISSNSSTASLPRSNSTVGEFVVGNEFNITDEFLHELQHEDERWQRKVKGWFSPSEPFDRGYLYEIRHMIMKRA